MARLKLDPEKKLNKVISIKINLEGYKRIKSQAKLEGITVAKFLRKTVTTYLKKTGT